MKIIRIGLCMMFAFSVLAFGGVEVWGESIIEISAAILLLIWAVFAYRNPSAKIQWNELNWPLLGFVAIGLFQLLLHGTAYPFLTRVEVLKLIAYFVVFFLTVQAFRTKSDFLGLAWFLILFCFAVSLLAIIQHFTSVKEIYWLSELNIQGDPFGPFPNRNHFAGFVELTLPIGLALMVFRGMRRDLFPLAAVLTIVPVSAMILSGSRGGIISFAFEVCVLTLLVRSRKDTESPRMAAVGIVALAALALIAWIGAGKAIERFSTLSAKDVSLGRRASMFRGAAGVFFDHPIKGSGLGALIAVYPRHETEYDGYVVEHVHNDYIEALAETGILGGLCGLSFLWLLYREARKNFEAEQGHFSRALHAGAIVALSGLLLHSFFDFNLHIPSNAMLFLLQACLATSVPLPSDSRAASHDPGLRKNFIANNEPSSSLRGRMALVRRTRRR
ncbi:MAG: O-antigen ligase family protein [Candidatus Acidiferrales bacterium]